MSLPLRHNLNFKIFVKEQSETGNLFQPQLQNKLMPVKPLTGEKAKELYEEIINEPTKTNTHTPIIKKVPLKRAAKPVPIAEDLKPSEIFKFAQNNDFNKLKLLLRQKPDLDINATDTYGWTALMCASCGGAKEAVVILLKKGADTTICDRAGNTAISLARKNRHNSIVTFIKDCRRQRRKDEQILNKTQAEPIFCDICKQTFKIQPEKHECSTLHLFNDKSIKPRTFYGIPDSNKGFQLLLKEGWDRETGLGPEGSGRKFPVKAKMKKDKKGIGAPHEENTRNEIVHTVKYQNKQEKLWHDHKDRSFERNFRLEFS